MSKDLKVLWTENAIQDLLGIKAYIAQDSIDRAEEWVFELYTAGESLSRLSGRGRIVPEFNQINLRELLIENYRLVYRVKSTSIEIITVFEGHRQLNVKDVKK
ncbi:MAG: type II toxin-antitoxin system RelE/ParE family toxin [Bdellovibrionales bacterium]|nr:type II toxin-antitoxin system RelE/ParE family toxin [Bdellovibrionales bacterium]